MIHKVLIILFCLMPSFLKASSMVENFNEGISSDWEIYHIDANGAPWAITAPDSFGGLQISKVNDSDPLSIYSYCKAGIGSQFQLIGDFSVSVYFNLVDFPNPNSLGPPWNEAVLCASMPGSDYFEVLRANSISEGYSSLPPPDNQIGVGYDPILQGSFRITRSGETLSAWIDRGAGFVLLGSETSASFTGPANIEIWAEQVPYFDIPRPSTSLDVRYDNLSITADSIVPEPSTRALLGMGAIGLLAYAWRLRK